MLIVSPRHRPRDLELWAEQEEADLIHAGTTAFAAKVERAIDEICDFAARKRCYAGVSWGKDSTVLAHLIHSGVSRLKDATPTLVWVKVSPIANPDCDRVADDFLERFWAPYHRVDIDCDRDLFGFHATGTLERGFSQAARFTGATAHISGVRAEESGERKWRMRKWGAETIRTLAPIGWWSHADVFGYLASRDLPVHPAYAMQGGGRWPRSRIRVASLGGRRGDGMGRAEWEAEYYGDLLRRLSAQR